MIVPTKLRNEKRSQTIPRKRTPPQSKLFDNGSSPIKGLDVSAREISLIKEFPSEREVSPERELE